MYESACVLCVRCCVPYRHKEIGHTSLPLASIRMRSVVLLSAELDTEEGERGGTLEFTVEVVPPVLPTLMDGKFEASKKLGSGAFGCVFLATSTVDDQSYAVKVGGRGRAVGGSLPLISTVLVPPPTVRCVVKRRMRSSTWCAVLCA